MPRPPWPYKSDFSCHRCGNCCRGDGYVEMTASDLARAAKHLGMTEAAYIREYCVPGASDPWFLKDQEDELQSCIHLIEDAQGLFGCAIHPNKPEQCVGFPFHWRPRNAVEYCDGLRALEGKAKVGKRGI